MHQGHIQERRTDPGWLSICLTVIGLMSCDSAEQHVNLTAQDSRFDPAFVRVRAGPPITLMVFNAGREVHEFASPLLAYDKASVSERSIRPTLTSRHETLEPGRSIRLTISAPPGTYLFWCKRKGHPDMTGTLVIEYGSQ